MQTIYANVPRLDRAGLEQDAQVRVYSERSLWSTPLRRLSLHTALLQRPKEWAGTKGSIHQLELRLTDGSQIVISATVAHIGCRFIAYRFTRINLDSFVGLKRLLSQPTGMSSSFHLPIAVNPP